MGYAYLPNGNRIDYPAYLRTLEWQTVRANRCAFDNWQCAICHKSLDGIYETHHINYNRLGHENIQEDVISLCPRCHALFHDRWERKKTWENTDRNHWSDYSLEDTAKLCYEHLNDDYFFGGNYNLCSLDTIQQFIDIYHEEHNLTVNVPIAEDDIRLFFRNMRYEQIIASADRGEDIESFLDRKFGTKGQKGGNSIRAAAKQFATKHTVSSMKTHFSENKNIIEIMKEVKKIQKENLA